MGDQDPYLSSCRDLITYFDSGVVLPHDEGHNIPTRRTNLYPTISDWIAAHVELGDDTDDR